MFDLIVFPMVGVLLLLASTKTLSKKLTYQLIGSFYHNVRLDDYWSRFEVLIWTLRRLGILGLALYWNENPGMQIICLTFATQISMIYVGRVKPYSNKSLNYF